MVPRSGRFTTANAKVNRTRSEIQGPNQSNARLIELFGVTQTCCGANDVDRDTAGHQRNTSKKKSSDLRTWVRISRHPLFLEVDAFTLLTVLKPLSR